MTSAAPSFDRDAVYRRVYDLLAGIAASKHQDELLQLARRLCAGREELAKEWLHDAYADALDERMWELAGLGEREAIEWLQKRIRSHARCERRRRVSPVHPRPAEPAEFDLLRGEGEGVDELFEEREEIAAFRKAFYGLADARARRALFMDVAGWERDETTVALGYKNRAALRLTLHRSRLRIAQRAEPIITGSVCREFQEQMPAALEATLRAGERAALDHHLAECECGCRRVWNRLEADEKRGRLRAIIPPVLLLPAAAGGVADAGIAEAGLHGFLGLSRLTYVNEMAGAHQFIAWAGDLLAWVGRPGALVSALALIPVGVRRGPGRWVAVALSAVAVLFLAGGLLHGFPGASGDPPPAGRTGAASSGAGAPLDPMAGIVARQTGRLIDAASARVGRLQRATEIAAARSLSAATQVRTAQAAW